MHAFSITAKYWRDFMEEVGTQVSELSEEVLRKAINWDKEQEGEPSLEKSSALYMLNLRCPWGPWIRDEWDWARDFSP